MNVAELEKRVSKERSMYSPEELFELAQNIGYARTYEKKPWHVLTKDEEFVAARVYRTTQSFFKDSAYPISGGFESLDEVIINVGEIEKNLFPFLDFQTIMMSGGAAAGLTGVFVASILEKYTDIFSNRPWMIVPALACQTVLMFSGLLVGGIIGNVVTDKRFSKLPQSAQEYLYGGEAVKDLLLKVV